MPPERQPHWKIHRGEGLSEGTVSPTPNAFRRIGPGLGLMGRTDAAQNWAEDACHSQVADGAWRDAFGAE